MKFLTFYDYLPATIISRKPFIFVCFFEDFIRRIEGFKIWFAQNAAKHKSIHVLFQFGFEYETQERMRYAQENIEKIKKEFSDINIYFLCSSQTELDNYAKIGQKGAICSHNAFLHPSRYKVLNCERKFDAIYLARITPFKRYELAMKVPSLLMIGDYKENEAQYAKNILDSRPKNCAWIRKVRGIFVYKYMNMAKVGLCLSAAEGAMFSCAEYGLSGLPIVSTKSLGGRQFSVSEKYTHIIQSDEPTADDVAKAVRGMIDENFNHEDVRLATIEVLKGQIANYSTLVRTIFDSTKEGDESNFKMAMKFPHKLGVRCRVFPWFKFFRMLKIKK